MRKDKGDMELAIDVPQPRLRAVPSEPVPQPLDDSPSDAELLARVGERDREAFEILYGRYVRPVFGLALRRLGDRGHAEDAVQEAFAAIWRSASTYRPERGAAGGWLYTVARNAIVDRLRRKGPCCRRRAARARVHRAGPRAAGRGLGRRVARAPRPRGAPAAGARGDRARVLERHVAERGGRVPPSPAWNREDPDAKRPRAPCVDAGRRAVVNRDRNLDELIGADTTGAERERLQRAHEHAPRGGPPAGAERRSSRRGRLSQMTLSKPGGPRSRGRCSSSPRPWRSSSSSLPATRREPRRSGKTLARERGPRPQGHKDARAEGRGERSRSGVPGRQQLAHDAHRRRPAAAARAQLLRGLPRPRRQAVRAPAGRSESGENPPAAVTVTLTVAVPAARRATPGS